MAKPGRNDPCPCGSGKKYKQCCGNAQNVAIAPPGGRSSPAAAPRTLAAFQAAAQLFQAGQLDQAEAACRKILQNEPNQPDTLDLLGGIAHALNNHERAIDLIGRAIKSAPSRVIFHFHLALAYTAANKLDEAVACYQNTLALQPDLAEAQNNLGVILRQQGQGEKARACFQHAIAAKPGYAEAHYNLGRVFKDRGKWAEAAQCFQKALSLQPDSLNAHLSLASAQITMGMFDEAVSCYEKILSLHPGYPGAKVLKLLAMPLILPSKREWIASRREEVSRQLEEFRAQGLRLNDPYKEVGICNFNLAYQGLNDRELQREIAQFYLHACPQLDWTAPHVGKKPLAGKLRIGLCSGFFYNHTMGKLTQGLIDKLDRSRFEVVVIHSTPGKRDPMSQAIDQAADLAVRLPADLFAAREQIAALELDALFYPDIGMDPLTYYLAFSRLAPVQAVSWGHPVTTGIPNVDYFLSSRLVEPEDAQAHYSEKLVEFEHLPSYYLRPQPVKNLGRAELGLPAETRLYVCPQSLFKFHPDFDAVLGELLRRDPEGTLVLISGSNTHWDVLLQQRFAQAFPDVADRVVFMHRMPNASFMAMLAVADAVLDPPFFGGGNTSYESFSVGAPIVTWPGPFMRGRVTSGCYQSMGFTDLIAHSNEEYISLAIRLAHDSEFHHYCKNEILQRSQALYENSACIKEMEDFFHHAVALATEKTSGL